MAIEIARRFFACGESLRSVGDLSAAKLFEMVYIEIIIILDLVATYKISTLNGK